MRKNLRQILSYNMKILRHCNKMSQAELAEKVNVSTGHIAAIETGKRFPSATVIERIAEALHVRPHKLIQDEEDMLQNGDDESLYIIKEKLEETLKQAIQNTLDNIRRKSRR